MKTEQKSGGNMTGLKGHKTRTLSTRPPKQLLTLTVNYTDHIHCIIAYKVEWGGVYTF